LGRCPKPCQSAFYKKHSGLLKILNVNNDFKIDVALKPSPIFGEGVPLAVDEA